MGACQPKDHKFEINDFSGHPRAFALLGLRIISGLSIVCKKRLLFCFVCYLFKDKTKNPGGDAFVNGGFNNWNMKARLKRHIGNQCWMG